MCLILLVEDHKLMAEVLVNALHKKGNFKVADVAGTAEEALVCLSEREVDLALVDVVLPHTSGIDLVSNPGEISTAALPHGFGAQRQ